MENNLREDATNHRQPIIDASYQNLKDIEQIKTDNLREESLEDAAEAYISQYHNFGFNIATYGKEGFIAGANHQKEVDKAKQQWINAANGWPKITGWYLTKRKSSNNNIRYTADWFLTTHPGGAEMYETGWHDVIEYKLIES